MNFYKKLRYIVFLSLLNTSIYAAVSPIVPLPNETAISKGEFVAHSHKKPTSVLELPQGQPKSIKSRAKTFWEKHKICIIVTATVIITAGVTASLICTVPFLKAKVMGVDQEMLEKYKDLTTMNKKIVSKNKDLESKTANLEAEIEELEAKKRKVNIELRELNAIGQNLIANIKNRQKKS